MTREIKIVTQRGFQVNPRLTMPMNDLLRKENDEKIRKYLQPFTEELIKCGGEIIVTVEQDGKTIRNQLLKTPEPLFDKIMEYLDSSGVKIF